MFNRLTATHARILLLNGLCQARAKQDRAITPNEILAAFRLIRMYSNDLEQIRDNETNGVDWHTNLKAIP